MQPIDLRSDTVTRPTPEMRAAMAAAPVGDDVYGEDSTVIALQEKVAELLGKEAALFVPSGTMSNQIGIRMHCRPGDEFICESGCHIFNYEQAGYAQLSGLGVQPIEGNQGSLELQHVAHRLRADDNDHLPQTRLLCLENTHNRSSGKVLPYDAVVETCNWAHQHNLATHLDGARLFNAVVASQIDAQIWSAPFDTVSVCFSKGLGAPVGSALAGPRDLIAAAKRVRKLFGGGMRQAGIIAAGALYALEHHIDRLAEDHAHAKTLATAIQATPGLDLQTAEIDTNIVIFRIAPELGPAAELAQRLQAQGILMLATAPQAIRAVIHLDISTEDIARTIEALQQAVRSSGEPIANQGSAKLTY